MNANNIMTQFFCKMNYDLKIRLKVTKGMKYDHIQGQIRPLLCHIRLWTDFDENCMNAKTKFCIKFYDLLCLFMLQRSFMIFKL